MAVGKKVLIALFQSMNVAYCKMNVTIKNLFNGCVGSDLLAWCANSTRSSLFPFYQCCDL